MLEEGKIDKYGSEKKVMPESLRPAKLLCPWNSPDKNTGVVSNSLLQGSSWSRDWTQVSHICRQILHSLHQQVNSSRCSCTAAVSRQWRLLWSRDKWELDSSPGVVTASISLDTLFFGWAPLVASLSHSLLQTFWHLYQQFLELHPFLPDEPGVASYSPGWMLTVTAGKLLNYFKLFFVSHLPIHLRKPRKTNGIYKENYVPFLHF